MLLVRPHCFRTLLSRPEPEPWGMQKRVGACTRLRECTETAGLLSGCEQHSRKLPPNATERRAVNFGSEIGLACVPAYASESTTPSLLGNKEDKPEERKRRTCAALSPLHPLCFRSLRVSILRGLDLDNVKRGGFSVPRFVHHFLPVMYIILRPPEPPFIGNWGIFPLLTD